MIYITFEYLRIFNLLNHFQMVMFSTIYIEGPMKLKLMGMETRVGQVAKRNEYRTKSGTELLSCLESPQLWFS